MKTNDIYEQSLPILDPKEPGQLGSETAQIKPDPNGTEFPMWSIWWPGEDFPEHPET